MECGLSGGISMGARLRGGGTVVAQPRRRLHRSGVVRVGYGTSANRRLDRVKVAHILWA
jgi:hypothetical protein